MTNYGFEVSDKKKVGRPKNSSKKQVQEKDKIDLKTKDALNRDIWRDGVRTIAQEIG